MQNPIAKERKYLIIYLLVFYILISTIFFKATYTNYKFPEQKNLQSFNFKNETLLDVEKYEALSDSINKLITIYEPGSKKMLHESTLNYELEELRKDYNTNTNKEDYKILHQLDDFYSNQFFDKKAIENSIKNSEFLKKNLEECEIGFKQTQNSIQLQEALKGIKQ